MHHLRPAQGIAALLLAGLLGACSSESSSPASSDTPPPPGNGAGENRLEVLDTSGPHQSSYHPFVVQTLAQGLNHPWALAFLPDGDLLITERSGNLRRLGPQGLSAPLGGVPEVVVQNQGGMLDVVLHPDFEENALVYLSYARACEGDGEGATTAVGRGTLTADALENFTELFAADACAPGGRHHAGRLLFDNDGYLFLTIGDRGQDPRAQDLTDHAGALLRLNDDGSVPQDNPYVDDDNARDEIWNHGHRNQQGLALHPDTGEIWSQEHGPRGGDEINLERPGLNYGWPVITHGTEYNGDYIGPPEQEGLEQPLKHWTPSIAPSGMAFYQGEAFPQWAGDIFIGALAGQQLARVRFDGTTEVEEETLLADAGWRIRDVRTGPDGYLYLLTDSPEGRLLRLAPQ